MKIEKLKYLKCRDTKPKTYCHHQYFTKGRDKEGPFNKVDSATDNYVPVISSNYILTVPTSTKLLPFESTLVSQPYSKQSTGEDLNISFMLTVRSCLT